jgi:lipopolysaccharide/colanic/teichoic acid biosynthesis glycosyltransferase
VSAVRLAFTAIDPASSVEKDRLWNVSCFDCDCETLSYTKDGFEIIPLSSKIYTKLGRVYEKYQFVELPQLLNIIKGDLSFVGYRPLPHKNINFLIDAFGESIVISRHKYRAGLSGYSQILGKDKFSPEERIKIELSLSNNLYEKSKLKSLKVYLSVLLDTFFLVIFDKTFFIKWEKIEF